MAEDDGSYLDLKPEPDPEPGDSYLEMEPGEGNADADAGDSYLEMAPVRIATVVRAEKKVYGGRVRCLHSILERF